MLRKVTALFLALLLISSLAISALAVSQSEIDALESQKEEIAQKKGDIADELAQLQNEQATIMQRKAALDRQTELTQREITLINEQIDIYTSLISAKEEELEQAMSAEAEQKESYRKRVRAMEESGPLAYIQIIFSASSFSDLLTRLDMISEVMRFDSTLEEQYIEARENVETIKGEYEDVKGKTEDAKVELLDKQEELDRETAESIALLIELESNITEYEAVLDEFDAEASRIQQEIDEKVQELERIQAAAAAAAEAAGSGGGAGGGSVYATGSLSFPVPGYTGISYSYGNRLHPILGYYRFHAGEDISAPQGTPIYAADGGTVITAAYNAGGYGYYVSISHGNGMATTYAHMTHYVVSSGQAVSQGDLIGYVGSTGLSTGPHLHFEVTVNGQYQNPMSYFGG